MCVESAAGRGLIRSQDSKTVLTTPVGPPPAILSGDSAIILVSTGDRFPQRGWCLRRRGPSLSRRTGQAGTVVQHSKTWDGTAPAYGKYWQDLPGSSERKRRTIPLGVCRTKSVARQRLREYLE